MPSVIIVLLSAFDLHSVSFSCLLNIVFPSKFCHSINICILYLYDGRRKSNFMSFCRILSTLCSHVVFHIVPHFSRGRQKGGTKSTVKNRRSGTKCKTPLLFVPLFWNQRNKLSTITPFALVIKLTITRLDGGFQEGGIIDGEIGGGEIVEGGC